MPDAEVRVAEVKAFKTRSGNTRFVLVDDQGKEYSTFKESIAARLPGLEGRRARITFHEQQRDGFTNVYLDAVEALEEAPTAGARMPTRSPGARRSTPRPICSAATRWSARSRPRSCSRSCSRSRSSSPTTSRSPTPDQALRSVRRRKLPKYS